MAQAELRVACAKKDGGLLRHVARAARCRTSRERVIRFTDDNRRIACAQRGGYVYLVAKRAACKRPRYRPSLVLRLPGNTLQAFCAHKRTGRMRSTRHVPYPDQRPVRPGSSTCKANERRLYLEPANRRPTAADDAVTVGEDGAAGVPVLANDTDRDGDRLEVARVQPGAARGGVTVAADRSSVAYDATGRFEALGAGARLTETFEYEVTDGERSDSATVAVTVQGANDAPAAAADAVSTDEGTATTVAVLSNDGDPDQGDVLSVSALDTSGTGGVVTIAPGGGVRYDPAGRFDALADGAQRVDRFAYTVADGHGGSARSTVTVTVAGLGDPARIDATDGALAYTEGAPATVVDAGLTLSDADDAELAGARVRLAAGFEAGDELQFTDQGGITGAYDAGTGVLTLTGTAPLAAYQTALRSIEYRHGGDDPAAAKTVEFAADDGDGLGPPAARGIVVTAVNDAPEVTASGGSAAFVEDAGAVAIDPALTVVDADSALLSGATVAITANFHAAQDALRFTDQNGITGVYNAGTGVLALSGPATAATYAAALRSVAFDNTSEEPNPAARIVAFAVTDAAGATSSIATRGVTVASVNDPPVVTTSAGSVVYTEGDPATALDGGLTVSDADDVALEAATIRIASGFQTGDELRFTDQNGITGSYIAGTGVLTLTGSSAVVDYQTALRSISYRHSGDDPATTKTVEFRADDGDGTGPAATRAIAVTPVDDAPDAVDDAATVAEGAPATAVAVLANDTDPDGGTTTIASATDPANGTVVLTGGTAGAHTGLTYEPDAGYCNDPPGTTPDTFTYTVNGGATATVSLNVTCIDDPPVAVDDAATVGEDAPATTIAVLANDTDADDGPRTITSASDPANGAVVLTGGSPGAHTGLTYEPDPQYCNNPPGTTPDTFTYTLSGGSSATVSVTVTCADDAPIAVNDAVTVAEDAAATVIDVYANDTDVDGGSMTVMSVVGPANGGVSTSGGGGSPTVVRYQPDPDYCNDPPGTAPDTFSYSLNGGSTATVSVTVTCVDDPPVADDETIAGALGNTTLIVDDASDGAPTVAHPRKTVTGDLLAGDTDVDGPGPLTVTPGTVATDDGGSVTIQSDGDFTYLPPAGCADASDAFTYTVEDGGTPVRTDTGTVTIQRSGCVWYVSNAAAGNDGTAAEPFDTLAQAETASGAGHTVFVFDGDGTPTGLGGDGYAMDANERLIGEHEGLQVGPDALHPANPGAHPTLTATNADVIALDDGNELRGLTLDPQGSGGGIAGGAGDTGGGTIDDVNVVDAGTAGTQPGLELDGTAGSFAITNLVVDNDATGVRLANAGTTDFGATTITSAGTPGLSATGTNMGTSQFDAITVTGSANGGVNMTTTTGTTTFGDLSLTTTGGTGFLLNNAGAITVQAAGTANVNATGGPAIDSTNTGGATLAFDGVSSTNSSADGINIANLAGGSFSAAGGTISGAAGIAFDVEGGSGTISYPGTFTNGQGSTAEITGRSGGTVTLSGAITESGDADATQANGGIAVTGNGGGSTVVSNATKTFNTGEDHAIVMGTSDGHTLNLFGGGLDIDTTSGAGLQATGSGTINVTGAGNTVASTTGRAVNVQSTDFGSSGFTFQSVSSNGAPNGIRLNSTGTTAGMTITGTGAANSGGSIQNATEHGVSLTTTTGFNADELSISGSNFAGVDGTDVTNFTYTDGEVLSAGDSLTNELHAAFAFNDLGANNVDGQLTITGNTVTNPYGGGVIVRNASGTLSQANVSTNAFQSTIDPATSKQDGISLHIEGTPTTAAGLTQAALNNNSIVNFPSGNGVELVGAQITSTTAPRATFGVPDSTTNRVVVSGNDIRGNATNKMGAFGVAASVTGMADGNVRIANNGTAATPMANILGEGIGVGASGTANADFVVENNFVSPGNVLGNVGISANANRRDVGGTIVATPDVNATIQNNTVSNTSGSGIKVLHFNSNGNLRAKVVNNTVGAPAQPNPGIAIENGSSNDPAFNPTTCAQVSANAATGSGPDGFGNTFPGVDVIERGNSSTTYRLQFHGLTPNPATAAQTETYLAGQNPSSSLGGGFYAGKRASVSEGTTFEACSITF